MDSDKVSSFVHGFLPAIATSWIVAQLVPHEAIANISQVFCIHHTLTGLERGGWGEREGRGGRERRGEGEGGGREGGKGRGRCRGGREVRGGGREEK